MIIKNNSVIANHSLGMTSMTPHITPTRRTFVGPLLEEPLVCIKTPRGASPRTLRVTRCPRAIGRASGVFYDVPLALLGETDLIHAGQRVRYNVKVEESKGSGAKIRGLERLFEERNKVTKSVLTRGQRRMK